MLFDCFVDLMALSSLMLFLETELQVSNLALSALLVGVGMNDVLSGDVVLMPLYCSIHDGCGPFVAYAFS